VRFLKTLKKYNNIQLRLKLKKPSILVVNYVSSCLSFILNTSTTATYIFITPIYTTTIIILEPCALMAKF
jgi:hypothetical protein